MSEEKPAPRKHPARRRLGLIVGIFFLGLVILRLYFTDDRLRGIIEDLLTETLAGRFRIQSLDWSLPAHVALEGVEIWDAHGESVVRAARVEAQAELLPLLGSTVRLSVSRVEGAEVVLRFRDDGLGLVSAFLPVATSSSSSDEGGAAIQIELPNIEVRDAQLVVQHEELRWVHEARLDAKFSLRDSGIDLVVADARLSSPATKARLRGALGIGEAQRIELTLELDADPSEAPLRGLARQYLPAELQPRGALTLGLSTEGSLSDGLRVALDIDGRQHRWGDIPLRRLNARAEVRPDAVTVERLTAHVATGTVALSGTVALPDTGHSLALEVDRLPVRRMLGRWLGPDVLPELVSAKLTAEGDSLTKLSSRIGARVRVGGLPKVVPPALATRAALDVELQLSPERAQVRRFSLTAAELSIRGRGAVPLVSTSRWALDLEATDTRPARLLPESPYPLQSARVSLKVRGAQAEPRAGVEARVEARGAGYAEIRGTVSPREVDVEVQVLRLPISTLTSTIVEGTLEASLRVRGPFDALEGGGPVAARGLIVAGVSVPVADARVLLEPGRVRLEDLRLGTEAGALRASGAFEFESQTFSAEVNGDAIPLSLSAPFLPAALRPGGVLAIAARASGTVRAPSYEVSARIPDLSIAGAPVGSIQIDTKGQGDSVDGTLSVDGQVGPVLAAVLPALPVAARVVAKIRAEGTLPTPGLSGTLTAESVEVSGRPIPGDVRLQVATSSDARSRYLVRGTLFQHLQFGASVQPTPELRVSADLEMDGLRVEDLWAPLRESDLSLEVGGRAHVDYSPNALAGEVNLPQLRLSLDGKTVAATEPVRAAYRDGYARIESLSLSGDGVRFEASGRTGGETLDFRAKGGIDLGFIAPFVPAISQGAGRVDLDAALSGTADDPQIRGVISVPERLDLAVRGMRQPVELRGGRLEIANDRVEVRGVRGTLGVGAFTADGTVELDGFVPSKYALTVSGENLPFRAPDISVESNVQLELHGEGRVPNVRGVVAVVRGRYLRRLKLQDFAFVSEDPVVDVPLEERMPWLREMALDIKATSSDDVDIRLEAGVMGFRLSLLTDLRITGTAVAPRVEGRVSSSQGRIGFPASELQIRAANVDFTPHHGAMFQTRVTLRAEGEVVERSRDQPYFVSMDLDGPIDNMRVSFLSDPYLSRQEVLLLLLTGYANEAGATGKSSAASDAALAFAGSSVTGPAARYFEDQLESLLNLELELDANVTSEGVEVRAKKEVTRRFRLEGSYKQGMGEYESAASAKARFYLLDRIFLESSLLRTYGSATTGGTTRDRSENRLELKVRLLGQ